MRAETSRHVTSGRRWWTLLLLTWGLSMLAAVFAPPASAHATVASSSPADGARVAAAPAQVSITFDEAVGLDLGYLRVIDSTGTDVTAGPATHPGQDGQVVSAPLKTGLGDGTYIASWRVISADSHPVEGTIRFVVGNGALATAPVNSKPVVAASTGVAFDITRTVSYAGLAVLGGGWMLISIWPAGRRNGNARRVLIAGWIAALVAGAGEMLLQGPYAAGSGLSGVGRFALFSDTIGTEYGRLHVVRLLLLAALGAGLEALFVPTAVRPVWRRSSPWIVVFLGVVYTFSAAGHAGVAQPGWLALGSDMAHLVAMSVWIGGLVLLAVAVLPDRDPADLRSALPVFSRVAFGCVLVIAASGTYQGWRESGTIRALTTTTYGLLVLAKVVLFLGLVALGNVSRVAIQRRYVGSAVLVGGGDVLATPTPPAAVTVHTGLMRRSVLAELALAAVVLSVTGVLVAQPPGRSAVAAAPVAPVSATATLAAGRTVTVTVAPARHGIVVVDVALRGGGRPEKISVTASLPAAQLGPLPVPLTATGPLSYRADGLLLPVAGRWTFTIDVQTLEFDAITTTAQIDIG